MEVLEKRLVLSAPPLPVIPSGTGHLFVVTAAPYNAVGDGTTDNSAAIQAAINACANATTNNGVTKGGTVEIPAGTFEFKHLNMASNVILQLDSGAVLQAFGKSVIGTTNNNLIFFNNISNFEVLGLGSGATQGTIDGNGGTWWPNTSGPNMFLLGHCDTALFLNVTITNAPHEHFACNNANNNVTFNDVTINTPATSPNTDGIDPKGSNWLIENCTISDGDDDIAPKPGSAFCNNITVQNCTILSGHGISIGSGTNDGINNFVVTNTTFNGTANGLRMKANRGGGGPVTNVTYSNITMTGVQYPILIDGYYDQSNNFPTDPTADKTNTVGANTPTWTNITFTNIVSTDTASNSVAAAIYALPEAPVTNMSFVNVQITAATGMEINHARNVTFDASSHITVTSGNALVGTNTSSFPTPIDAQITEAGFTNQDIGAPTVPFDTSESLFDPDTHNWTIDGGGAGITSTSDQFNFTSQALSGDGNIAAEITGLSSGTAGVMFRASTNANDPFAAVVQSGSQTIFEWRTTAGGAIQTSAVSGTVGATYVKVVRSGSNFSGFYSTNGGSTYTQIGSAIAISAIPTSAQVGLADSSNSNGSVNSANFANVTVTSGTVTGPTVATPAAATPNPVTGTTTALSVLGADPAGESTLTYTWSTTGTPPAAVNFSANGTNASKSVTATFSAAGSYSFLVTIKDASNLTTTSSVNVTVNQVVASVAIAPSTASVNEQGTQQFTASAKDQFGNAMSATFAWSLGTGSIGSVSTGGLYTAPIASGSATVIATSGAVQGSASVTINNATPTIASGPSAVVNAAGTSVALSVLGADDGGESNLIYTWLATTIPSGVTAPTFDGNNGTNAGKNETAVLHGIGSYLFQVTITDSGGKSVVATVSCTVNQVLTSIAVSPASATVPSSTTQQFSATGSDQFGNILTTQPSFTWSLASGSAGSIDSTGLYTAPNAAGSATVKATSGSVSGSASVTVTFNGPTVATPASATPNPVTGTTTALSVLGSDPAGESTLTYTWSTTGTPPAAVNFSDNGTNTAKNATATFSAAGTYNFLVTITDASSLSTTSSVSVTVNQTVTSIAVSPANPSVNEQGMQQFSSSATDQYGNPMAASVTWSLGSGSIGSISAGGLYTAPVASGSATVIATSGSVQGSTTITVNNAAPTVASGPSAVVGSTGNSVTLAVLGADDGGESNLTYTWSATTVPAGVTAPTFSSTNGLNSGKNVTATVNGIGSYTFGVTITDSGGKSVSTSINVTVGQVFTSMKVTPTSAALSSLATQQFTATGLDQFGNSLATQPTFTWSLGTGSVGSVNSGGLYTAPGVSGSATVTATSGTLSSSASVTVTSTGPTVATAAAATPNPVTAKTTALSVLGADPAGESNLIYSWSTTGTPPAAVVFSANGTNAAKSSTATFSAAGTYNFLVTIKDSSNLTTTSGVSVTVNQTLTAITLSPTSASIASLATQQFTATGKDQFGTNLTTQPTFTWSLASGSSGSVSASGLYTAPAVSATATVQASSGSITGTAAVTITSPGPSVATAAAATPNPVTGTTTALSVLGSDPAGESTLTYTWATTGTPPAAVVFSANGTNASKNVTATFAAAGSYTFQVTIKDSSSLTKTSSVSVTVNQTVTTITVTPATASINTNATQQFAASAKDQFGTTVTTQPTFTWSVVSGGVGTISTAGLYSAGATAGSATVHAVSGSVTGAAAVTVTAVSGTVKVNLSSSFNRIGYTTDGTSVSGTGIDGSNDEYSGSLLLAGSLGTKYSLAASNVNNVVAASGQTITLTQGKFSTLTFLGAGINGQKQNKTFVVNYTDGTSTTFSVSLSNWHTSSNFAGETIAQSFAYENTTSGGKVSTANNLYQYTLTLNNTKTIASITLPNNTDTVIVMAIDLNP